MPNNSREESNCRWDRAGGIYQNDILIAAHKRCKFEQAPSQLKCRIECVAIAIIVVPVQADPVSPRPLPPVCVADSSWHSLLNDMCFRQLKFNFLI